MRAVLFVVVALAACSAPGNGTTDGGHKGDGKNGGSDAPGDGPPMSSSAVSIIVEPDGMKGAELVSAINAAHTSVYMTMYQIDDTDVIDALVARAKAGLDVQAVLDGSSTCKSWNTSAYNTFNSNGVKAVWSSPSFTYTHEKTVIIDGTTAWIMTMNANTSSPEYNREYLAIDTDASDVAEATAIFKADHAMQSITPSGALVVADTNARQKLVQLINSATKTLDVEVEEFSDTNSNGIVDAVTAAANRGVTVRVVIANDTLDANGMQAINMVKNAGGKVVMTGPTSDAGTASNPYIHAKAIIVDCVSGTCASGFVGSENFSAGSVGYNRELGVIFDEADQLAKVESSITSDFSRGTAQ